MTHKCDGGKCRICEIWEQSKAMIDGGLTFNMLDKKEFESGAQKEIAGKLMLELVTPEMINALGEVLTYGAQKYANRNWEKGIPLMQSYAAAMRHMLKWAQNIDLDDESNLNHISHAMCNLGMIITQIKRNRKDLDDRPK